MTTGKRRGRGKARSMPPAMILCGGMGTRLRDVTELLPKPMVPIGSQPILWHIMKSFAHFGVDRFILCLGYKREAFIDYFLNYHARATDLTITLGSRKSITYHGNHGEEDWTVTLADTGERTQTGGRVARAVKYLAPGDESFFLTYGDGLSDVDIGALRDFHDGHDQAMTLTAVHPAGRFGELHLEDNTVTRFHEKPQTESGLINGGFMVMRRRFVDQYLDEAMDGALELEPMRRAAQDGQMAAYQHHGFWQCMDTAREHALLSDLWQRRVAPWAAPWAAPQANPRMKGR